MAIRHGKLVANIKAIGFLELTALQITTRGLELDKRPRMTGSVKFIELESGDVRKKIIAIESFVKEIKIDKELKIEVEELVRIVSLIEFHEEGDLWLPRILKLKFGEKPILHFIFEIKRDASHYEYTVQGPVRVT